MTATAGTYAIDVEDIEYLRHGTRAPARLFKPRGAGPSR